MPKVSVIIPVYNTEKYIQRCVESVRNQTLKDIEIILVDDGSTDMCSMICDEYQKLDDRIIVVHKKNSGVAAARNTGMTIARGEYIIFVDSDDYIDDNMYQKMLDSAQRYDCDVVLADCYKEYSNETIKYSHDIRAGYYSRTDLEKEYFKHLLIMENIEYPATISNWLCLFRRSLVQEEKSLILKYKEGIRFSEDLLFGAQLLYNAESFYYMKDECLYHYCMNETSVTHNFNPEKWNDYIELYQYAKYVFGASKIYDFSEQLNLLLLFFVYNMMGDIMKTSDISWEEKKELGNIVLNDLNVRKMFKNIRVNRLSISPKLKVTTFLYKYRLINLRILWRKICLSH